LLARPNVGVKVAPDLSPFKRNVIVRLRREIEAAALMVWFERKDPALLESIEKNLAEYREACAGTDLGHVVELDMAFHRQIVEAADDGSLVDLWLPVILRLYLRYSRHRSLMESYQEHVAIVQAIKVGHEWQALELLKQHIV
jgi:DNA-binding GntR family transcriptional regulator